jgi:hypothetical protein
MRSLVTPGADERSNVLTASLQDGAHDHDARASEDCKATAHSIG